MKFKNLELMQKTFEEYIRLRFNGNEDFSCIDFYFFKEDELIDFAINTKNRKVL